MIKKNGFTLVELIGVIVILSLIIVLVFDDFTKQIKVSKQKAYERQVTTIISAAKDYYLENLEKEGVTIKSLDDAGLINASDMKDPRSKEKMNGCVLFGEDSYGQTEYNYIDNFNICFDEHMNILYSINNLIANGGFEDENTGWTLSNGISVSTVQKKYGNNSMRNSGSAQSAEAYTNDDYYVSAIPGHKYYVRTWLYTVNRGNGNCYNNFNIRYNNTDHYNQIGQGTSLNTWQQISNIYTIPNVTSPKIGLSIVGTSSTNSLQDCYGDGIAVIDLTELFGMENEPSKEWCDVHIPYIN